MARKKEIILQEVFNTPEAWDEAMGKQKLYVVDVHQKWCGPCKAITGMLKRIKNELGDDYLCFAVAEADSIPSLEAYRGKCEPVFLFFGCGNLVAYVRGCDAPLLQQTIMDTLAHEKKILDGEAERKVINDLMETEDKTKEEEEEETGDLEEEETAAFARKQISVAVIKPDVVANGQVDEILEKIKEAGIEVLVNEERVLSDEEAKKFYQNKADEEYFDELISYVTSGPCRVLVLTKDGSGEGVVEQWRDIIGPFDAAVAKEENPETLRAIYGTDAKANALHGSSSRDEAAKELAFFFPEFEPPTYRPTSAAPSKKSKASARSRKSAKKPTQLQRTLAIIRPDALKNHKDAIMEKIGEAGFEVSMMKEMQLSEEQAKAFYKEHENQDYFQALVDQMTSGPVLALCLAHVDAVQKWRNMLGPKEPAEALEQEPDSLRAQFHVEDTPVNMLHGSDSVDSANEELKSIFDIQQTLVVIKPDAMEEKDAIIGKLKEAGFMISTQKDMNLTKEIAGQIYKSKEGAEFYDGLIDHMTSGPTLMMVLSAEDAVSKLRNMIGPTDPEEAKEAAPESLRALFAKSVLENAVHSPSTAESANEKIKIVFGDLELNWDGTLKGGTEIIAEDDTAEETAAPDQEGGDKTEEEKPGADEETKDETGEADVEKKEGDEGEEKKEGGEDEEKKEGDEEEKKEDEEEKKADEEETTDKAEETAETAEKDEEIKEGGEEEKKEDEADKNEDGDNEKAADATEEKPEETPEEPQPMAENAAAQDEPGESGLDSDKHNEGNDNEPKSEIEGGNSEGAKAGDGDANSPTGTTETENETPETAPGSSQSQEDGGTNDKTDSGSDTKNDADNGLTDNSKETPGPSGNKPIEKEDASDSQQNESNAKPTDNDQKTDTDSTTPKTDNTPNENLDESTTAVPQNSVDEDKKEQVKASDP